MDDVRNPFLPPWERVLDEEAQAGYRGLELGPYGYLPLDLGVVAEALGRRDLFIVAGTIFDDLVAADNLEAVLRHTEQICALISALPPVPRDPQDPGQHSSAPGPGDPSPWHWTPTGPEARLSASGGSPPFRNRHRPWRWFR